MAKRKRQDPPKDPQPAPVPAKTPKPAASHKPSSSAIDNPALTLQIVTGSYERVLHGFTATLSTDCFASPEKKDSKDSKDSKGSSQVQFADTFLFEAHSAAIRCLALSPLPKPDEAQRIILASGSSDERVNLYSISANAPSAEDNFPAAPSLAGRGILENPKNQELGSLLHHDSSISSLDFPSRSKLLASSEDNTISVTKTRDWTVISTIKAPRPKIQGRPSGDTAPPGGSPAGVNDFAVHPSMKLMLSVGRGEKCMRLWNLVTGKKAGVLSFNREMLQGVKEGKWSSGEGRKIIWNTKGEEFAVAFEWGIVIFGVDSTPVSRVLPNPRSKVHQMKYITLDPSAEDSRELLAVSTEDGRIIFYATRNTQPPEEDADSPIPYAQVVAQLGGKPSGLPGRVKDFEILSVRDQPGAQQDDFLVVAASSDGLVRVWLLNAKELSPAKEKSQAPQVGKLLNAYETGNRITCLKAFVMLPASEPTTEPAQQESESESESGDSEEDSDSE